MATEPQEKNGIYKAMIAVMKKINPIAKERRNQQQNFNFRGVEDFYNTLHDIMADEGVFNTMEILADTVRERQTQSGNLMLQREITYKFNFIYTDGSQVSTIVKGEAMDTGDKASNKCASIAHKYALATTFLVPYSEMDDPDQESHEVQGTEEGKKSAPVAPKATGKITASQRDMAFKLYKELHGGTDEEVDAGLKALFVAAFKHAAEEATTAEASQIINRLLDQKKSKKEKPA